MKRDDIRSIIEGVTDEQLDAIMNLNGEAVNAEKAKTKEAQAKLDETKDALAELTKQSEAKAKESMTIEERMKAMEESYAAKERELAVKQNTLEAQRLFTEAGLVEQDYSPLLASVVTQDAESTIANAKAIANLVVAQRNAQDAATRKSLMDGTPSPGGGTGGSDGVTREQFDSMTYSQRLKLFNESPDTYRELTEQE